MTLTRADRACLEKLHELEGLLSALAGEEDSPADSATPALPRALELLLSFHADGLARMLEAFGAPDTTSHELRERLLADPLVSAMLLVHGLHPQDVETRVRRALDQVRPYLQQHHGNVAYVGFAPDSTLQLRLEGNCHGCPSSQATLKGLIEESVLLAAPEITAIEVQEPPRENEPGFVPVSAIQYNGCPFPAASGAPSAA